MVIYGEYLFLENFITGGILLLFTGKLLRCKISKLRLLLGAVLCGAAGFAIFISASPPVGVLIRIGIAGAAVLFGFGGIDSPKGLLVRTSVFMALTLVSGGLVMALMLWQKIPSISGAKALYVSPMTYMRLMWAGSLALGFSYWTIRLIRKIRLDMKLCDVAEVEIDGKRFLLKAMIDTGNYLKEPVSGKPVALIAKGAAKKLGDFGSPGSPESQGNLGDFGSPGSPKSPENTKNRERYRLIPFHSVGNRNGMLEGIRTDCIYFRGNQIKNAVIAFYDGNFEESDIILGRDFLDRGLSGE